MLRLSGTTPEGHRVVTFVLEPENVTRMRAGLPIDVDIQRMAPDLVSAPLLLVIKKEIRNRQRTWTNEAHLARENIHELGQFIETSTP